jgi:hypothetical protein
MLCGGCLAYRVRDPQHPPTCAPANVLHAARAGRAQVLGLPAAERFPTLLAVASFEEDASLVVATSSGGIKRTRLSAFARVNKAGLAALKLAEVRGVCGVGRVRGGAGDAPWCCRCCWCVVVEVVVAALTAPARRQHVNTLTWRHAFNATCVCVCVCVCVLHAHRASSWQLVRWARRARTRC